jgi:transposase
VKLVRERGVSVSQAARDLDLHENVLRKWVREQTADPGSAFPGHGVLKPEQQQIERLRRELARMKAERDILKKAATYFARDSIWGSSSSRSTEGSGRCRGSAKRSVFLGKRLSCLAGSGAQCPRP